MSLVPLGCIDSFSLISFQWKQLAHEIGTRLYGKGVILTAETRPFTAEEVEDALGTWAAFAYGSNCISHSFLSSVGHQLIYSYQLVPRLSRPISSAGSPLTVMKMMACLNLSSRNTKLF